MPRDTLGTTRCGQQGADDGPAVPPAGSSLHCTEMEIKPVDETSVSYANCFGGRPGLGCAGHPFLKPEVVAFITKWIDSKQGETSSGIRHGLFSFEKLRFSKLLVTALSNRSITSLSKTE
jgi:hypothetical protein